MRKCLLKDVCLDFIVPQRDKPKVFDGDIPWCRIEDIEGRYLNGSKSGRKVSKEIADRMNMHLCPKGSVICACSASIGNQAITTVDCYTNQTFIGIVPNPELLDNVYLYYFFAAQAEVLKGMGQGATIKYISQDKFKSMPIPVPSLPEQQRIVDILDKEFAKIDALKANAEKSLQAAKDLFQATLKKELEPKKEWEELAIPEVSENLDSKRVPITKSVRENGHYPYYGASGIVDYVADYIFDEPLLLVSEDGANLLARSTPIAFSIEGKVWVNNHAHVLRFDDYKKQKFVEYWFAGNDISSLITGAAQPKFNQKALNSIKIAFPMKEQEMEDILDRLGEMEGKSNSLQENYQKTLSLCDDLKQSLLRKAFNGEL